MPQKTKTSGVVYVFQFCFACIFAVLLASMLFFNNNSLFYIYSWQFWVFLIAIAIVFLLLSTVLGRLKNSPLQARIKKNWPLLLAIAMVALFVFQIFFAWSVALPVGWDIGFLAAAAANPGNQDSIFYFSVYPNNLFLLMVYRVLWRIVNLVGVEFWFFLALVNIVAVNVALVTTVVFIRRKLGLRSAALSLFMGILLFGLSPWIVVLYSDTFVLPFVAGTLLLYDFCAKAQTARNQVIFAALMGISIVVGTLIKPTAIIVLIAIALAIFVKGLREPRLLCSKQNLLRTTTFLLVSICTFTLFQAYIGRQKFITVLPDMSTPMAHYLMMGLREVHGADGKILYYGAWNEEDVVQTHSLPTTKEKTSVSLQHTLERWKNRGFAGTMKYYFDKLRWFTADGTFNWGGEAGENFMVYARTKDTPFATFVYANSPYYSVFSNWMQAVWVFVWILVLACAHLGKKYRSPEELLILQIAIVGILLFVTLFEGRSRYLFLYTPFFVMAATYGIVNGERLLSKWWHRAATKTARDH